MGATATIVLSSGETSGDLHASHLIRHLRQRIPGVRVKALGGDECQKAGAELLFHFGDYAILGFTGVLANLPKLWRLERAMKRELRSGADLFIAVDYPGLNLRLAEYARRIGVPVLYYISPQVWAWGEGRLDKMKKTVNKMAVILPFEEEIYARRGIPVEFVGHPFISEHALPRTLPAAERRGVGLLPGSRTQEVRRVLPVLLDTARLMAQRQPGLEFTVARSPAVAGSVYDEVERARGADVKYDTDAVTVMQRSQLLLTASGTATLQGALLHTPLVIVYRVSPLNYWLARRLVRIDNIGLVNVILGERVCPEFIQGDADAGRVAAAGLELLGDQGARERMLSRFHSLHDTLAGGGGCARVAEMAAEMLSTP